MKAIPEFPLESEMDEYLQGDATQSSLRTRSKAADLVRIGGEWLARTSGSFPSLVQKLDRLDASISALNAQTRLAWRGKIATITKNELSEHFNELTTYSRDTPAAEHYGAEELDLLLDCILDIGPDEHYSPSNLASHVHYEPAPASVVLEMIDLTGLSKADTFYDIGSGLGRVNMMISLLTDAISIGVELDPLLANRAASIADEVRPISMPRYIQGDATGVDTEDATVYFLFTPFTGAVMESFLSCVRDRNSGARICTYGNCTQFVANFRGIIAAEPERNHPFKLGLFSF